MWHHTYDSGGAWLAMASMMTLMSVLTAAVVIAIVRAQRRDGHGTACRVPDERYARGELDSAEYAERRRELTGR